MPPMRTRRVSIKCDCGKEVNLCVDDNLCCFFTHDWLATSYGSLYRCDRCGIMRDFPYQNREVDNATN